MPAHVCVFEAEFDFRSLCCHVETLDLWSTIKRPRLKMSGALLLSSKRTYCVSCLHEGSIKV